jgi:hypothetical protein
VQSVGQSAPGTDGISYLIDALGRGLKTPLSDSYEAGIKRLVEADTLKEALQKLQSLRG